MTMAAEVYVVTSASKLIAINTQTLKAREVGNTGATMTDVAFAPDGKLYAISFDTLYRLDPKTGATLEVHRLGIYSANAFEIGADGKAYIASSTDGGLYSVDLKSGSTALIGNYSSSMASSGDLAFYDGKLYLTTSNKKILSLDPETGKALSTVSISVDRMYGLEQSGSTLYGFANNTFYSVDPKTGKLVTMSKVDSLGEFMGAASRHFSDPDDGGYKLTGTKGQDWLFGNKGADILYGRGGDDFLYGDSGKDRLYGESGADVLDGGKGADRMYGGKGNDTYIVDNKGDKVIEKAGEGTDFVKASISYKLTDNVEKLILTGSANLNGTGNGLANAITGNSGKNTLSGGSGNDTLKGKSGADTLIGGKGADKLYGGSGADTFVFKSIKDSTVSGSGRDTIYDFSRKQDDTIDLKAIDANTKSSGDQAFKFIGKEKFHKKAGELRFEKDGGDTFVYGDVNGDAKADFAIKLDLSLTLFKSDFIL
ncbi:PQQ-binding-like beta-propeller repeat protein [Rhizobium sp. TRM96647]|uniref:DUF6923 family protein n=1 Tax=unclassified Rhizobium TaxID=2613769 RepID=UPI0021E7B5AA|nr:MULTISPECIES: PQQ-binding-like beta-propeller repeat protein [unclassified Rhizobium]MCV3737202.1 PQQ-binding-like beta-propeller repeat protein [Rhizobium sp. TRM96647]MCV3759186.1 PQQ-binding-like beta-propeller repeat protein [Rhizobium sp. TRM96650]